MSNIEHIIQRAQSLENSIDAFSVLQSHFNKHKELKMSILNKIGFMDHIPRFVFGGQRFIREDDAIKSASSEVFKELSWNQLELIRQALILFENETKDKDSYAESQILQQIFLDKIKESQ